MSPFILLFLGLIFFHCSSFVSLQENYFPRRRKFNVIEWANFLEFPGSWSDHQSAEYPPPSLVYICIFFIQILQMGKQIMRSYGKNQIVIYYKNTKWYFFLTVILRGEHCYTFICSVCPTENASLFLLFPVLVPLLITELLGEHGTGKSINKRGSKHLILWKFLTPFYIIQISLSWVLLPRDQISVIWQSENLIN